MATLPYEELKSLLALNHLCIYRDGREFASYLKQGMSASELVARIDSEDLFGKAEVLKASINKFQADEEIENCRKNGIKLLTFNDPDYPFLLQQIPDPPLVLYFQGDFEKTDQAALAIVGSRHPSFYGISQARKFSRGLAQSGITIVSGFAKGIDQIAHQGALEVSFGRTISVLGCGLDVDYPKGSGPLFKRITERGVVLSEYPLGTQPRAENFPRRNRIISGLSLGVLVVEAHSRSGSLITAHEGVEQGREVFAIPGPVDQLTSRGTHKLLKEGAALVEIPEDVLEALALPLRSAAGIDRQSSSGIEENKKDAESRPIPKLETAVMRLNAAIDQEQSGEDTVLRVLAQRAMGYDEIANECFLESAKITPLLTRLELSGKIRKSYDGRFSLKTR